MVTAELSAIADPERQHLIDVDVDEALWEESETGLRHQGRITVNFLALMALGGAIAAVGLVSEPVPQVIALVAASVIAPGFEPVAKLGLGLALRRGHVVKRAAVSALAGYGVLLLAAALTFALLRLLGDTTPDALVANPEVHRITHPSGKDVITSICAAAAGMVMVTAYRRSVLAGPLIALLLIPAAATIGAAAVSGRWATAAGATGRLGLDVVLVVVVGALVVAAKKATVHRRDPLV